MSVINADSILEMSRSRESFIEASTREGIITTSMHRMSDEMSRRAATGTVAKPLQQTEAYEGYRKTVKPATNVTSVAASVALTIYASNQLKRYESFNEQYGDRIESIMKNIHIADTTKNTAKTLNDTDFDHVTDRKYTTKDGRELTAKVVKLKDNVATTEAVSSTITHTYNKNASRGRQISSNVSSIEKIFAIDKLDAKTRRKEFSRTYKYQCKLDKAEKRFNAKLAKNKVSGEFNNTKACKKLSSKLSKDEKIYEHQQTRLSEQISDSDRKLLEQAEKIGEKTQRADHLAKRGRRRSLRSVGNVATQSLGINNTEAYDGYNKVRTVARVSMVPVKILCNKTVQKKLLSVTQGAIVKVGGEIKYHKNIAAAKRSGKLKVSSGGVFDTTGRALRKSGRAEAQKEVAEELMKKHKKIIGKNQKVQMDAIKEAMRLTGFDPNILAKIEPGPDALKKLSKDELKSYEKHLAKITKANGGKFDSRHGGLFGKLSGQKAALKYRIKRKIKNALKKVTSKISSTLAKKAAGRAILKVAQVIGKMASAVVNFVGTIASALSAALAAIAPILLGYLALILLMILVPSLINGIFNFVDGLVGGEPNISYAVDKIYDAKKDLQQETNNNEFQGYWNGALEALFSDKEFVGVNVSVLPNEDGGDPTHYTFTVQGVDDEDNVYDMSLLVNSKGHIQDNDREILSVVSPMFTSYGAIGDFFKGHSDEKRMWKKLVGELYGSSHEVTLEEYEVEVQNYRENIWTGELTPTSTSTYIGYDVYVDILRGNRFFDNCKDIAIERIAEIIDNCDPEDISIDAIDEDTLRSSFESAMEKNELWTYGGEYMYKGYEVAYFDPDSGFFTNVLKKLVNETMAEPKYTYEWPMSDKPDDVHIIKNTSKYVTWVYIWDFGDWVYVDDWVYKCTKTEWEGWVDTLSEKEWEKLDKKYNPEFYTEDESEEEE